MQSISKRLWLKSKNEVLVFTDTMHGIEQDHKPINRELTREDVVLNPKIKNDLYAVLDQFFNEDRSFFQTYWPLLLSLVQKAFGLALRSVSPVQPLVSLSV